MKMKRCYPFDDFFTIQHKRHVGEKEVNGGVMHPVNMHKVYAKTMQMLKDGSRNLSNNNVNMVGPKLEVPVEQPSSSCLRQMSLTTHGTICFIKTAVSAQGCRQTSAASARLCHPCNGLLGAAAAASCSFCESPLCGDCLASCCRCSGTFCRHCRVVVYDRQDDVTVCLSCNR